MNSKHEYWIAFDRGYRNAMRGRRVVGDPTDKANVSRQIAAQAQVELARVRAEFHQIITEEHPHRHAYMADCVGEMIALRRLIARNN